MVYFLLSPSHIIFLYIKHVALRLSANKTELPLKINKKKLMGENKEFTF
jgi:hypothetical protein